MKIFDVILKHNSVTVNEPRELLEANLLEEEIMIAEGIITNDKMCYIRMFGAEPGALLQREYNEQEILEYIKTHNPVFKKFPNFYDESDITIRNYTITK